MILGELYRHNGEWKPFRAVGQLRNGKVYAMYNMVQYLNFFY